jgi:hypothetical protein
LVTAGDTVVLLARCFDQPDQPKIGCVCRGGVDHDFSARSEAGRISICRWQSSGAWVVVLFYLRWLVSRPAVNRRYLKAKKLFDRCAAGVMAALGLRLLLNPR